MENTSQFKFTCLIPNTIPGVQKVTNISYSMPPRKIFVENGNKYVEFFIKSMRRQEELIIRVDIEIMNNDFSSKRKSNIVLYDSLQQFLKAEKFIQSNHEFIKSTARKLKNIDDIATVNNIFDFVNIELDYNSSKHYAVGAVNTLNLKRGDCTEYTDLFVALCRANNIPAKAVTGYVADYNSNPRHAWPEAYLKKYGWVRFDPTGWNAISFRKLNNNYIQLSEVRNDEVFDYGNSWKYSYVGDPIEVSEELNFKQ